MGRVAPAGSWAYNPLMNGIRAVVRNGRLVVDEPTDLPEGMVLDLVVDDEGDELPEADRLALHAALGRSMEQLKAGATVPAAEVLDGLRPKE